MRKPLHLLPMMRDPLSNYGSLEPLIRGLRESNPLDLNAEHWREKHPGDSFANWVDQARSCLKNGLNSNFGPVDLQAEILDREDRGDYIQEFILFNTTPWIRIAGYFLYPKGLTRPAPAIVLMHEWGGPMLFGKERVVCTGQDHPALEEHRATYTSGNYLAEVFVRQGFAVIVIDAHHFGDRAPRGLNGIPDYYDPFTSTPEEFDEIHGLVQDQLYLGVRQLNWAGTTWAGINFCDDSRCVDYLRTRKEVDPERIGCTGLSGGGWRTNILAALDRRIRASVSVGWMTTGDYQQIYNLHGAVGTFCLLPGVWNRMDVPDLTIMAAPGASLVVVGEEDHLFPPEAFTEAVHQIQEGFAWAGCPNQFAFASPAKPHCYDAEIQEQAVEWFKRHLG